ncbi:MAG: bifunctional methylenetetrahydrofolate dehydrogenase/methenyltetrahydrofolate cyclohydrolase FolD [Spirochaetia bacterium]
MADIIDGKAVAKAMRSELAEEVDALKNNGIEPGLAVILVGDDPASHSYVRGKEKACASVGIKSKDYRLPADITQNELLSYINTCNQDPEIHGILVQLPLPDHIDDQTMIEAILPEKDVDGFHPVSVGKMLLGMDTFLSCTPHGILHILKRSGVQSQGKHVVIVGRSNIVGKPLANMLIQKNELGNATVTICHTRTADMAYHTKQADILVAAAGRPNMITQDMVKPGAVVIDVGVNRVDDPRKKKGYRLCGDVDFQAVQEVASKITPVPGGVGPMTITMLLYNTVKSAKQTEKAE